MGAAAVPRFASARKRAILKGERRKGERERGVDNDMPPPHAHASAMRHHLFEEDVAAVAVRLSPLLSRGCQ